MSLCECPFIQLVYLVSITELIV